VKRRPAQRGNSIESGWDLPDFLRPKVAESPKASAPSSSPPVSDDEASKMMMTMATCGPDEEEELVEQSPIEELTESIVPSIPLPCKKKIVKQRSSTTTTSVAQQLFDFPVDRDALLSQLEQELQLVNEEKARRWGIDFSKDPEEGLYLVPSVPVLH